MYHSFWLTLTYLAIVVICFLGLLIVLLQARHIAVVAQDPALDLGLHLGEPSLSHSPNLVVGCL